MVAFGIHFLGPTIMAAAVTLRSGSLWPRFSVSSWIVPLVWCWLRGNERAVGREASSGFAARGLHLLVACGLRIGSEPSALTCPACRSTMVVLSVCVVVVVAVVVVVVVVVVLLSR